MAEPTYFLRNCAIVFGWVFHRLCKNLRPFNFLYDPYETSRSAADLHQICFDRNRSTADYFIVCRVCFQSAADVKLEYPSRC